MKNVFYFALIIIGLLFSKITIAQQDSVLFPVTINNRTVYLNSKGQVLTTDSIHSGDNFSNGFAIVTSFGKNGGIGKRGAIDVTGKMVVPFGPSELYFYPQKKWWVAQYYPDSLRIYPLGGGPAIYDGIGKFVLFYPEIDRMIVNSEVRANDTAHSILLDMNGKTIAKHAGIGTVQFAAIDEYRPGESYFHNRHSLRLVDNNRHAITDIKGKILFDSTNCVGFSQGKMVLTGQRRAAIVDTLRRQLIPFSAGYTTLEIMNGTPYYFARKDTSGGIIDEAQNIIFPFILSGHLIRHDNRVFEMSNNKLPQLYSLYSYAGEKLVESKDIIELQSPWLTASHQGFPIVIKRNDTTYQLWKDHFIGKPYRLIGGFSDEGWAIFVTKEHSGLLDTTGHEVLVTDYQQLAYPVEGVIAAGEQIPCPDCDKYPCASTIVTDKETKVQQYFFLDMQGHRLSNKTYDFVLPYQHGQASVSRDCNRMVINKNGEAINKGFIYLSALASGVYIVQNAEKKCALADTNGKIISPWVTGFQTKEGRTFSCHFVGLNHNTSSAIGTIPLPMFEDGRIRFEKNGKAGFMDSMGKVIIPANYSGLKSLGDYILVYQKFNDGTRTGLLDAQGKELLEPIYERIRFLGKGYGFLLQKTDKEEYVIYNAHN